MASSPSGGGGGRGGAPSSGRGGGGGRGRSRGGRGRNNKRRGGGGSEGGTANGGKEGAPKTPAKSNGGGRNGGGARQRQFSARGGGGNAGRGNGNGAGGRGSATRQSHAKVEEKVRKMSDQDVLIAFGPHVRSGDAVATRIHQEYIANQNQREFIKNARNFLVEVEIKPRQTETTPEATKDQSQTKPEMDENQTEDKPKEKDEAEEKEGTTNENKIQNGSNGSVAKEAGADLHNNHVATHNVINMVSVEEIESQIKAAPVSQPTPSPPPGMQAAPPGLHGGLPSTSTSHLSTAPVQFASNNNAPSRPPPGLASPPPGMSSPPPGMPPPMRPQQNPIQSAIRPGPPPGMPPPMRPIPMAEGTTSVSPTKIPTHSILPARTPPPRGAKSEVVAMASNTPAKAAKVRRSQTRCEQQPGRLFANNMPAAAFNNNPEKSLTVRPRSELTAKWVLPLPYLRNRALRRFNDPKNGAAPPQNLTIRDALKDLAVGLFRRGAADTGSQCSIVTKEILASGNAPAGAGRGGSEDYFFNVDPRTDSVYGTVPFYSPRTPGNVVMRLYFEDDPQVTLATGPCIHVVPKDGDVESVLRFILSNIKTKKTERPISSLNSLASVLELFKPTHGERFFEDATRVAWGCICETRKIVQQAGASYVKKKRELDEKLESLLEAEKIKKELPDLNSLGIDGEKKDADVNGTQDKKDDDDEEGEDKDENAASEIKAKWSKEKHSNERKWSEMQLVYASVLKAAVTNEACSFLFKRDVYAQIQLEYELWCPLTESFAPNPYSPSKIDEDVSRLPANLLAFPKAITEANVAKCRESRSKMQEEVLGFAAHSGPINPSAKGSQWKKAGRNFFKELTAAMNEIYRDEYAVSDKVWRRREKVRATVEHIVSTSGEFPNGTKVAVFGSSANGFGSPNSDLDLCLQVPPSVTNFSKEEGGVEAMTKLAEKFTEAGLTDVDTVRLTARIPIVKFNVPYSDDGDEILVECDLSLQNPLACLNTSLLHAYAKMSPTTCILASIIKRWAKSRDINNPSQHTLSSYGYVIMLLSFLTSCDFSRRGHIKDHVTDPSPIVPNLQLVDPTWAQNPAGACYREMIAKPKTKETMVQHPTEPNYYVNSYFYRSGLEGLKKFCSENHDDESALGALLAGFFHYFAYDFDYKHHVVSLNTNHSSHRMEREVKAEEDGWSLFKPGLAIEDPFELFYDVAHVVRVPNFHHIRKEFCLAYDKIFNAANANGNLPTGREIIDLICEPVASDDESTA